MVVTGVLSARSARYLLVAAVLVQIISIWFVHWIDTRGYLDIEIYRLGARAWLNGYEIYGGDLTPETPDEGTLPFIYPPIAAIGFVPLTWISGDNAVLVVALLSHLSILVTAYALARSSSYLATRSTVVLLTTVALMPLFTLLEPARDTINYGQINLWMMGLVAADCLLPRTRWPRGLLVGIAGAIKLTPLGFLLFFLLRRDFRAAAVAALTFSTTVLVGALAAPEDAATWWLDTMLSTGDSFGTTYAGNLNLRAIIAKQDLTGVPLNSLWIIGCIALVALAALGMIYALRTRNVPLAVVINAVAVVLVSPISWSHHWVWAGPTLALLFAMTLRNRWYGSLVAVAFSAVVILIGPQWYLPYGNDEELNWTFSQQVVGNAYTLIGIAFLIVCAVAYYRFRPRPVRIPSSRKPSLVMARRAASAGSDPQPTPDRTHHQRSRT